jgi:hypothetical protein
VALAQCEWEEGGAKVGWSNVEESKAGKVEGGIIRAIDNLGLYIADSARMRTVYVGRAAEVVRPGYPW